MNNVKLNTRLWLTLSAISFLLASCTLDETTAVPETSQPGTKLVLTATIDAVQTKATVEYGQPYEIGEDFTWEYDDLINIALEPTAGGDGTMYGFRFKVIDISSDGNTATLEQYDATDYTAPTITSGEYKLYATYPSDIRLINGTEYPVPSDNGYYNYLMSIDDSGVATWQDNAGLPVTVSQPDAAVNLTDNTDPTEPKSWLYMYDWQPAVNIGEDAGGSVTALTLNFKHYTSLLRYTVTNKTESAVTMDRIRMYFGGNVLPFAGGFRVDEGNPSSLIAYGQTETVVLSSGVSIDPDCTVDFYCPIVSSGAYGHSSYDVGNATGITIEFLLNEINLRFAPITMEQFVDVFGTKFRPGYRYAFNVAITAPDLAVKRMKDYTNQATVTFVAGPGVEINGLTWATCNVDAPGTFAANPEDAGMYYQWNRNVGWSLNGSLTNSNGGTTWDPTNPDGVEWEAVNDPCPDGWHVPTLTELQSLTSAGNTMWTQNGVSGMIFGTVPDAVFLPTGGFIYDGILLDYGLYWSSNQTNAASTVFAILFANESSPVSPGDYFEPSWGGTVRCVADGGTVTPTVATVSVSYSPVFGGTTSGAGSYAVGESCTVTATANSGYIFHAWYNGIQYLTDDASYTFTVTEDCTLTAVFISGGTVTVSSNPVAGGTTSGGGSYAAGANCTVTATANHGYTFVNWTEDGVEVSTDASYTFTVSGDRTLVANFTPINYTVTVSSDPVAGGTASGGSTYSYGANCTVTATANQGYTFVNWTEGGVEVSTDASYTFTVSGAHTLVANFTPINYTVTASSNPVAWGTASGDGTYSYGANCTVTATATYGYTFVNWTEGDEVVSTDASYTFTVSGAHTLVANFVEGVLINGTFWATRNVGMPGTFAANPEDAGMFYQWNREVGWSSTGSLINSNGGTTWNTTYPSGGGIWLVENSPCPDGWRVPLNDEFTALVNAGNIDASQGGVTGRLFGTAPNTVFLPYAGYRTPDLTDSTNGYYWCASYYNGSDSNGNEAYIFKMMAGQSCSFTIADTRYGMSVRCVKK
ncbi:MAG: hypothetical protein LBR06_00180 [Bacteroidales bacterium]|jgi:uncharacterized protein (TIGR02145 family)/uncharacterized repeat protein (TIGR02543 family)|nr:hypothetical protein [Bacteroidales bacterium]